MPGDFNQPNSSTLKVNILTTLNSLFISLGIMDGASANPPNGYIRYNPITNRFEQYSTATSSWSALDLAGEVAGLATIATSSSSCTGNAVTASTAATCSGNAATANTAINLSGTPLLPNGTTAATQTPGDNSTKIATTAFVQNAAPISSGSWTPTDASGGGLALVGNGTWYKIGKMNFISFDLTFPVTGDTHNSLIAGLPFTSVNGMQGGYLIWANDTGGYLISALIPLSSTGFEIIIQNTGVRVANNSLSGATLTGMLIYQSTT